jgi:hypothetical protein
MPGSVGTFAWGGLWGTRFWIDPTQRLIAIQMIQVAPDEISRYYRALRYLTYAALHDRRQDIFEPPPISPNIDADELTAYAGHYDFGASLSTIDQNGSTPVSYGGLGLDFGIEDGLVKVRSVYRGGPAALAVLFRLCTPLPIAGASLVRRPTLRSCFRNPISVANASRALRHVMG